MTVVEVVAHRVVDAPAERAWAALTDWTGQGSWIPATTVEVRPHGAAPADARGVGGRLAARTGFGPLSFLDTMVVTTWDAPYRCEVEHTGKVVRGIGWFAVDEAGTGRSRVEWGERLILPFGPLGRVGWLVGGPLSRLLLRVALSRFARHVAQPS